MSNPLEDLIKEQIRENGPMDVGTFMSLALGHPEHGYYMKQDPFGKGGDFTTAPEVSQMFGEMLGAWSADVWMQLGSPERLVLLECGPGRGTLMADMLRAVKAMPGFLEAAEIHLLEMSPVLKEKQAQTLDGFDVQWHEHIEDVSGDAPMILIANEFLDALPFRQFVKTDLGNVERKISLDEKGDLCFTAHGDVFEKSPEREAFVKDVVKRLKDQNGAALFIDYGHMRSASGDTFQAVKDHAYVDVLSNIGDADLTSHVDFEALASVIGVAVHGPVEQGAFLKALGIEVRADILKEKASSVQKDLHRLTHADEMGTLFKVLGFSFKDGKPLQPAGF